MCPEAGSSNLLRTEARYIGRASLDSAGGGGGSGSLSNPGCMPYPVWGMEQGQ